MTTRWLSCLFVLLAVAAAAVPAGARGPAREVAYESSRVELLDAGQYTACRIPGLRAVSDPGAPSLPYQILHFVIPADSRVEDVVAEYDEITMPGTHRVLPAQKEVPTGEAPIWTEPDAGIYGSDAPYPAERVVYLGDGYLGGYRIASVAVYPLQYTPTSGRLSLATDVSVRLVLGPGADRAHPRARMTAESAEIYRRLVEGLVENPEDVTRVGGSSVDVVDQVSVDGFSPRYSPSLEGSPVEYVIITNDELSPYFQELADWKTKKGVPAVVRTVDWINSNYPGGCDDAERIRLFIQDAYTSWGTAFVLLGGDTDVVPPRFGWSDYYGGWDVTTDLYYGDLDGNWNDDGDDLFGEGYAGYQDRGDSLDLYADVFVGRAPATTPLEAATFVDKVMTYEKSPNAAFAERNLHLAEVLFPYDWEPGQVISSDGAGDVVEPSLAYSPIRSCLLYQNYTSFPGSYQLGREAALDSLALGYNITTHVGHGNKDILRTSKDQYLYLEDVSSLTNGVDRAGFMWMLDCTSTAIESDCISERFINDPDGGASALWGPSRFCFPTTAKDYFAKWFERFYTEGITRTGVICAASRSPFVEISSYDNTDRWTQMSYILLGDPETRLLTGRPKSLTVVHSATVPLGTASVNVTVTDPAAVDSALVCLAKSGEVYATAYTNASGHATLNVTPQTTGQMTITVTAQNRYPYEDTIGILSSPGAHITYRSSTVDDDATGVSDGNGNGRAEAGETVELDVTVGNGGGGSATGVTAELSTADAYTTLVDSTETLGTIAGGSVVEFTDAFALSIDNDCPNDYDIPLTITFTSTARTTWTSDLTLRVSRPELVQLHNDPDDGNDGVPSAGETVHLTITLLNEGNGDADAVSGVLRYPSAEVSVTDSVDTWGDILEGESLDGTGGFTFTVNSAITDYFELELSDGDGKTWTSSFDLFAADVPETLTGWVKATTIYLAWHPVDASDLWGYNIYRSETEGGTYTMANDGLVEGIAYYEDAGLDENQFYFYKVTSVDDSGNESAQSEVLAISTNPPSQGGWPLTGGAGMHGTPVVCDVDMDGHNEVLVGASDVYCWRDDGAEYQDGDGDPRTNGIYNDDGYGGYWSSLAVGELDGDEYPEIVGAAWGDVGTPEVSSYEIFAWNAEDSSMLPGWPVTTSKRCWSTPAMGDLDGDGLDEVAIGSADGYLYVFHGDGTELIDGDSNPSTTGVFKYLGTQYQYGSPAMADIDGDHDLEIVMGSRSGKVECLNPDGSDVPGWPFQTGGYIMSSVAIGDVDNDGAPEIVAVSNADSIWVLDASGVPLPGWPRFLEMKTVSDFTPSPALADLDGDDDLEVVAVSSEGKIRVWTWEGSLLPGWPKTVESENLDSHSSPVVGDVDGEPGLEIVVGSNSGKLYAFDTNGNLIPGWPIQTGAEIYSTATLDDVDLDGDVDVLLAGMDRKLYIWDCYGDYDDGAGIEWSTFKHSFKRNGFYNYEVPVDVPEGELTVSRSLVLEQNVPNPFNPVTTIAFSVPEGVERATLSVYNLAGGRVAKLIDGPVSAGRQSIVWNGRDASGRRVASGVYFVRLEAPGMASGERKMILLK